MKDSRPAAGDLQDLPEADQQLFGSLNEYWEALRRDGDIDPSRWQGDHPGSPPGLPILWTLAALDRVRRVLDADSATDRPDASAGLPPGVGVVSRPLLEKGTRLGECRIVDLLGYGGMGEVYLAEHELLRRQVAIKVLPAHLAEDPEAVRRFQRSVEILARLQHEHIAAALHASTHQGRLYLVLEHVPGVDLKTQLEQTGPLPVAQACALVRQTAEGLDHAHRQGIVHRDIKPANLMLTPSGTVKILDLGLARLIGAAAGEEEESWTHPGVLLGTLDYIAPEQARDARQADARSDLYSLGCTFFFLLTGQPPFAASSHLEKVVAHVMEPPPGIRELCPDVPPAIAEIVERLLAKKPEDRYPTARALIEALDAALASPAATSRPGGAGSPGPRPRRSRVRQAMPVLAAAGLLVVLIGLVVLLGKEQSGPSPPVRIDGFDIILYRGHKIGIIGTPRVQSAQVGEVVKVRVQLSQPAWCYLIAYNPDGQEQVCYPGEGTTPKPIQELVYPADGRRFGFEEKDIGMQAFVLVASRSPLPPYEQWKAAVGDSPWKPVRGEGVWSYDGEDFERLGLDRGPLVELPGLPEPFAKVCRVLKDQPDIEAIRGQAFPVVRPGAAPGNP
jgi:hypothetical protein